MQQAAHTANNGAADVLQRADAVMAERSTAPVQHPVSHTPDEVEMSIGPSPADDDQRSRVYIMISKKGNQTQYDRDSIMSTIELELETAGWESSPGLPSMRQCPGVGPFPLVLDKGGADMLRNEIDLFDGKGDPSSFEIYRIDANGKRLGSRYTVGMAEARAESEDDARRRTVITYYDLPLELCGKTIAGGSLRDTVRLLERAQFICVGTQADRVNVNQPVVKGRVESKLAVYTTLKEGVTNEQMRAFPWQNTRFVHVQMGTRPMTGTMAKACSLHLGRAPCCLRTMLACPGREVCLARDDAWRRSHYTPPQTGPFVRVDKRAREEQKAAAENEQRKASKTAALRQRMARLCEDFREGKVRRTPHPPRAVPLNSKQLVPAVHDGRV